MRPLLNQGSGYLCLESERKFNKFQTPTESTIQSASDSASEHCLAVLQTLMAQMPF